MRITPTDVTIGGRFQVLLRNTAVGARSTTQHCVTLSTSEAAYVAMSHGAKTALATKAVFNFVQPHLSSRAIDMYEDNEGTKALAENPRGSHHSKQRWHLIGQTEDHFLMITSFVGCPP